MKCPKFGWEITDSLRQAYCRDCEGCPESGIKPRFEMGKVDIFKLARLLKEKEEKKKGV